MIRRGTEVLHREGGVAQAEAEWIADLLRGAGDRLEVAVAHEDVLVVLNVVDRIAEALGGGIGVEVFGEGVGKVSAGADPAAEHVGHGAAALDAALPGEQHGLHAVAGAAPAGVHHAAGVEHDDDPVKRGEHLADHGLLGLAQVEVAVVGQGGAVGALAGIAAQRHQRGIGVCAGLREQRVIQRRLGDEAGRDALRILLLHIAGVVCGERRAEVPALQGAQQAAAVGGGHVAAAAAALDVVGLRLAEDGQRRGGIERQGALLVLEQHHALGGGFPRERDVRGAGGDARLPGIKRERRHMVDALPFAVHGSSSVSAGCVRSSRAACCPYCITDCGGGTAPKWARRAGKRDMRCPGARRRGGRV